jgi:hypothetical protein
MLNSSANTTIGSRLEPGTQIRAVGEEHVPSALLVLREASQWLTSRGLSGWSDSPNSTRGTAFISSIARSSLKMGW